MRKIILIGSVLLVLGAAVLFFVFRQDKLPSHTLSPSDLLSPELISSIEGDSLSTDEVTGLIMMREEEKLARDVYLTLYDMWGLQVFANIARSEQTHTDAVKTLLDRYNLEDPVVDDARGLYMDSNFTELYRSLVEQGSESLLDALIVGATIEDLDILDLEELIAQTDNADIAVVYTNLIRGSENHIRSFYRQITSRGGDYSPVYISQERFDGIIGR